MTEYAQYGEENSQYLFGGPSPQPLVPPPATTPAGGGVQPLPEPATLQYGNSQTTLASQLVLAPRWRTGLTVNYSLQGGLDPASREALPFTRGPRADASLAYALTRLDTLESRAWVLRSDASSQPCSPLVLTVPAGSTCAPTTEEAQVEEVWRHALSRAAEGWIRGGVSFVQSRLQPQAAYTGSVYPLGSVGLDIAGPPTLLDIAGTPAPGRLHLELLVAPVFDIRTALVDERAQATAIFTVPFRTISLIGSFAGTRSVATTFTAPLTSLQGGVEVAYRASRTVSMGAGVRFGWQEQDGLGAYSNEMVFTQLTITAPAMRF